MRSRLLAVPAAAVLSLALTACEEDPGADGTPTTTATASADSTDTEADAGGSEDTAATDGSCDYVANDFGVVEVDLPPAEPTVSGEVSATIATSAGDLALTLDADRTPCTVNSFVSLAGQGYFDGTDCHRVTDWGVLQCGDPSGTGSGGPGYSFADELDGTETYPAGTLAMANGGPDTNGSQFFILYADTGLTPDYTVFGSVDEATVQLVADVAADGAVDNAGNAVPDGSPATQVTINGVQID